ncbi:uncharacterized protein [Spinacia oleracea]|uniref:CCHC-type domain-containing protein n=1 Tax=Spinacia oleracea TaxID=3562 RepID=A0ABM3RR69_SPIOL|nr:uncharacterized protein LOC130471815 [Spinacia oleracea]
MTEWTRIRTHTKKMYELDFVSDKQASVKVKSKKIKKKVPEKIQRKGASPSTSGRQVAPSKKKMKKDRSPSTSQCFNCNEIGHYKQDFPKLKEEKKDGNVASPSGTKER